MGESERDLECYAAGFEDGGRGSEPRYTGSPQELEKARERFSPRASGMNTALPTPRYNPVEPISISALQN